MRLEDITKPFLKSNLTISEFAKTVNLTPKRIAVILKIDLINVAKKLNADKYIGIIEIKNNREKYLNYINQYYKICEKEIEKKQSIENNERIDAELRLIEATKKLTIWQIERLIRRLS